MRRDLLAKACARDKIPVVTPNDLRRTFASLLKQAGNDSMVVAKLLGDWTTRMVELVYGHLSTNEYLAVIADLPPLRDLRLSPPVRASYRIAPTTAE